MTRYNPADVLPERSEFAITDSTHGLSFVTTNGTMYKGAYSHGSRMFWGVEYWNKFTNGWSQARQSDAFDISDITEWWYE